MTTEVEVAALRLVSREREAVIAFLRRRADEFEASFKDSDFVRSLCATTRGFADEIERGEHMKAAGR